MKILETFSNFVTGGALTQLREQARGAAVGEFLVRERLAELEMGLEREGWDLLLGTGNRAEFTNQGLATIRRLARLMWLKNPLVRRGVNVQANYVFGQGATLLAADKNANTALQEFWDDLRNQKVLTSGQALKQREREQNLFGETFFAFFTNRLNGHVKLRVFDCDSITDVICNPDDREDVWFYERRWMQSTLDYATKNRTTTEKVAYHPDWHYNPKNKPKTLDGHPIEWDVPVYHVKTGGLSDMLRGVSEVYCQLDWAKAYTKFLENRASVASALARFALKATAKTKAGVAAVKAKISSTLGKTPGVETNPAPAAGATAIMGEGRDLEAITVKGATINPDEGRRFLLMVACGAGLPETFYGDASVGSLATAESLDRPTEMQMEDRRDLWRTVLTNIAVFVLMQAVKAPQNALKGTIQYNGDTPVVILAGGAKAEVEVVYPDLLEHNVKDRVTAIDTASKHVPKPKLIARLMLTALGVKNVDELVKNLPEDAPKPVELPSVADTKQAPKAQPKAA